MGERNKQAESPDCLLRWWVVGFLAVSPADLMKGEAL